MKRIEEFRGWDAIIVGAGHNGLICAGFLARAKKKVLVLERQAVIGGAAVTAEISPQFQGPVCAHLLNGVVPEVFSALNLAKHGLTLSSRPVPLVALSPDQRHIIFGEDHEEAAASISQHSQTDAVNYAAFVATLARLSDVLNPLINAPPIPLLDGPKLPRILDQADRLLGRLERDDRQFLMEIVTGPVCDILERTFETPLIQGALAMKACLGNTFGPRSRGTGLSFLLRSIIERDGKQLLTTSPKGGIGAFSNALGASARKLGAEIRVGTAVSQIIVENGRACGVRLEDGTELRAPIIVSSADPKQTFTRLVPPGELGTGFLRGIKRLRSTGMTAKVNLALDQLPQFPGLTFDQLAGRLVIAPGIDAIEAALTEAKSGRFSQDPVMEITLPSIHDPDLAPVGQHVMSIIVQYAPYQTEGGWQTARDRFAERVLATLARYAPDIRERVLAGDVMGPADLEANFGLPNGDWHHVEPAPDQMFWLRPTPGAEAYATPLPGLYLCGVGCHPAGDVTGLPGRNAARVILGENT